MGLWSFFGSGCRKFYPGVVVESVSPPYYAVLVEPSFYPTSISGSGFNHIPSDAVAIISTVNDEPLRYRYSEENWTFMNIVSKSDNLMSFSFSETHQFPIPLFIGAIVSADRSQLYWVNNSQPL